MICGHKGICVTNKIKAALAFPLLSCLPHSFKVRQEPGWKQEAVSTDHFSVAKMKLLCFECPDTVNLSISLDLESPWKQT